MLAVSLRVSQGKFHSLVVSLLIYGAENHGFQGLIRPVAGKLSLFMQLRYRQREVVCV